MNTDNKNENENEYEKHKENKPHNIDHIQLVIEKEIKDGDME